MFFIRFKNKDIIQDKTFNPVKNKTAPFVPLYHTIKKLSYKYDIIVNSEFLPNYITKSCCETMGRIRKVHKQIIINTNLGDRGVEVGHNYIKYSNKEDIIFNISLGYSKYTEDELTEYDIENAFLKYDNYDDIEKAFSKYDNYNFPDGLVFKTYYSIFDGEVNFSPANKITPKEIELALMECDKNFDKYIAQHNELEAKYIAQYNEDVNKISNISL